MARAQLMVVLRMSQRVVISPNAPHESPRLTLEAEGPSMRGSWDAQRRKCS